MKKIFFSQPASSMLLILTFLSFTFSSCGKKTNETLQDQKIESNAAPGSVWAETNYDLLSVDYNYFYNELSPYGEWIEVSSKDMGIDIKTGSSSDIISHDQKLFTELLGIKTAGARTEADMFNLFVWRPANDLAANMISESGEKEYVPYNNGQWIYTDEGWYFKANTPQEDLTCHYGRWTPDPKLGWVWVPGRVYAPAWVEWRENDDYVAWAPIPPGTYIRDNTVKIEQVNENRYTIVEKKMFMEPSVYKYRYQYVENKNKIMIKEMKMTDGVMVKNKIVIDKGPEVSDIEKSTGKKIETVKVNKTNKKDETSATGSTIIVYTPEFKKTAEIKNEPVSKPGKFVSYKDAKSITKEEKEELKEKELKQQEKGINKEEKGVKKEEKKQYKEKGNKKDDMSKEKGDKGKKNEDNVQGKNKKDKSDNIGKDKGNKKSGDDVNKGNKGKK